MFYCDVFSMGQIGTAALHMTVLYACLMQCESPLLHAIYIINVQVKYTQENTHKFTKTASFITHTELTHRLRMLGKKIIEDMN